MAAMRPLKAVALLGLSPLVASSATALHCKNPALVLARDVAAQCSTYSTTATSKSYSFRLAAAYSGKGKRFEPRKDLYQFYQQTGAPVGRVRREDRPNSGQDAFFIGDVDQTGDVAFGVADGVGGWAESGIDPADFSHGLCEYMRIEAANPKGSGKLRPRDLLQTAFDATQNDRDIYAGGSTACVAVGREEGVLEVANLGDSGFVQLRPNAVSFASEPQTHAFNTPYQLSLIPPEVRARQRAFGGEPLMDSPANASVTTHKVRHGDVFVFASDGVWDNLSPSDVLGIVTQYMVGFSGWRMDTVRKSEDKVTEGKEKQTKPNTESRSRTGEMEVAPLLADITEDGGIGTFERTIQGLLAVAIAGEAKLASINQNRDGPFARELKRYYPNEDWHGGKVDDICVIVAVVVQK